VLVWNFSSKTVRFPNAQNTPSTLHFPSTSIRQVISCAMH
jgi:hypothetical protein